jgi:hypothetical protein
MSSDAIQKLLDIQEITALKSKYCRCVDTKDWAGYGSLLVDDYYFEAEGRVDQGRDNVVAFVSNALKDTVSIHHVHNPEISVNGDTASGVWAMIDYVVFSMDGAKFSLMGYGWYHEDYVRTAAGWRLKKCVERRQRVEVEGDVPEALAKHMATLPAYHIKR